jgi:hypothetical protein
VANAIDKARAKRDRLRKSLVAAIEGSGGDANSSGLDAAIAKLEEACEEVGKQEAIQSGQNLQPYGNLASKTRQSRTDETYELRRCYSWGAAGICVISGFAGIGIAAWRTWTIEANEDFVLYLTSALPSFLLVGVTLAIMGFFGSVAERLAIPLWIAKNNPSLFLPSRFVLPALKLWHKDGERATGVAAGGGGADSDDDVT